MQQTFKKPMTIDLQPPASLGPRQRAIQDAMRRQMRDDSCLDKRFPLVGRHAQNPEYGPTVENYYDWKHTRGPGRGRFYPLHELAISRLVNAEK